MNTLVVLFALASVAAAVPYSAWPLAYSAITPVVHAIPIAQPSHYPAVVLDPHGRPLDTAEVIAARALHLQAKALEGHYLKKRSVLQHVFGVAPSAVSHQSRVDVHTSPAVVAHAPVLAHSVAVAPIAYSVAVAPLTYAAPVAVSHQSRVDVHTSPAVVAHTAYAAPAVAYSALNHVVPAHSAWPHYLKKRSLVYSAPVIAPAAVSHQSRVDVHTSPAVVAHTPLVAHAPLIAHSVAPLAHTVYAAPAAVSHQSRVDYRTSHAYPLAHSLLPHYSPLAYSTW